MSDSETGRMQRHGTDTDILTPANAKPVNRAPTAKAPGGIAMSLHICLLLRSLGTLVMAICGLLGTIFLIGTGPYSFSAYLGFFVWFSSSSCVLWAWTVASGRRHFRSVFGVIPPRNGDWKHEAIIRDVVSEVLKQNAIALDEAYSADDILKREYTNNPPIFPKEAERRLLALSEIRCRMRLAEKRFWRHRALAGYHMNGIKKTWQEYVGK
jgi:hypothetical protein